MMAAVALMTLTASGQREDPNNKYLVWTNNITLKEAVADSTSLKEEAEDSTAVSFMDQHFRFLSLCDWKPGETRFMVIPDKKDMVVRTFADAASNLMVSSMTLRHKILVYQGHSNDGGLHDHINFSLEEDSTKHYYYEIPNARFEDYCYTKFGVPTLAYLGDVDKAREVLVGKKLLTNFDTYNVDISTTSYGYDKKKVNIGTEVTVVAAGVGTRQFPVKLIVEDAEGHEFFQNVAISRTNSGLRDEEFGEDNVKHTFDGSFILLGDAASASGKYQEYVGRSVYTLYKTKMRTKNEEVEEIPRLTAFKILAMQAVHGTHMVKMKLVRDNKEYSKDVTFVRESVVGDIDGEHEDYYFSLFASGNIGQSKGVRQENLADVQKSIVRKGFNEAEVKLALGNPDKTVKQGRVGNYQWIYNSDLLGNNNCVITFNKNKIVVSIQK